MPDGETRPARRDTDEYRDVELCDAVRTSLFLVGYSRGTTRHRYRYLHRHVADFLNEAVGGFDLSWLPYLVSGREISR